MNMTWLMALRRESASDFISFRLCLHRITSVNTAETLCFHTFSFDAISSVFCAQNKNKNVMYSQIKKWMEQYLRILLLELLDPFLFYKQQTVSMNHGIWKEQMLYNITSISSLCEDRLCVEWLWLFGEQMECHIHTLFSFSNAAISRCFCA